MVGQTRRLAVWVHDVEASALSADLVGCVRARILDAIACAGAGSRMPEMRALSNALANTDTDGPGQSWFSPYRCSLSTEVFVNASLIHALDWDDSHPRSKTHPGAPVIPVALAIARWAGADLSDLFAGIVAGYEVSMRLANAVGVAAHRRSGWHATATCGSVGAAAAAARVLRLAPEDIASALGHGATQAAGLWAFATDGAMSKKIHPGHAARAGLTAAILAKAGVSGSRVVLEATDGGFFRAFAPDRAEADWSEILAGIGFPYWLPEVATKPYPCCRTAHTAIDAVLAMRADGLCASDVGGIDVYTYELGVQQCGFNNPVNEVQAAFSTPYVVACALSDGWVGPEHFTAKRLKDPALADLQGRVRVRHDPRLDESFPDRWPSRVVARTADGKTWERRVDVALGDPAAPMSESQLQQKFSAGVVPSLNVEEALRLSQLVGHLPICGDASALWDAFTDSCPSEG